MYIDKHRSVRTNQQSTETIVAAALTLAAIYRRNAAVSPLDQTHFLTISRAHSTFERSYRSSSMDTLYFLTIAHDTLTRTVLRVRDSEQHVPSSTILSTDAVLAVLMLFSVALLPVVMRVRVLYTFCWTIFTVLAHVTESKAALGLATSLGLTIMMGWYSLRVFDRTTFMGILQGWFGAISKYGSFQLLAISIDLLLHMGVPLALVFCYLPLVRIWMTAPILL